MNNIKQVIVMRKDLNMRKGKMIAQGAHASMKVILDNLTVYDPEERPFPGSDDYHYDWKNYTLKIINNSPLDLWINGLFKKIVVGVDSLADVVNSYEEAKRQGMLCSLIYDAGLTEFGGERTITCCAIGPDANEKIDKITGKFSLL